jgi:hypothetical protein
MPLTTCTDCGKEISDAARACIHCGRPLAPETNVASVMNAAPVQVVYRTSIFWTLVAYFSYFVMCIGLLCCAAGAAIIMHLLGIQGVSLTDVMGHRLLVGGLGCFICGLLFGIFANGKSTRPAAPGTRPEPPLIFGRRTWIVCPNPNCRYRGQGKQVARGSFLVAAILLLLGVIPGVLYILIYEGYRLTCPQCGIDVRKS